MERGPADPADLGAVGVAEPQQVIRAPRPASSPARRGGTPGRPCRSARTSAHTAVVHLRHVAVPVPRPSTIRSRPPLVTTVHTLVLDESAGRLAGVLRRFEALLPRHSDRVIAVSQQIADRFAGVAGAERIVVIPPVSDPPEAVRAPAEVRASLGVDLEVPLVMCVARLHPQKDLPTFVRAVKHLQVQVPAVRAAIVGEGPDEACVRALVDELGLAEVVVLAGRSPNAADEMAAADVVALSSRGEGNPITLAEAMQLEVPVAATAVGAVPTLVEDGVTGRLVPPGDPAALAAACADLLGERGGGSRHGGGRSATGEGSAGARGSGRRR
ncbi:MAG: glycosyltransferase [Acidimicrobiales bacterium]